MTKLILFDIDGTLVLTGGAGARSMGFAFRDVFGLELDGAAVAMAGRTDAWIVSQMARHHGIKVDDAMLARFHSAYVGHLEREIHEPGPRKGILPGVRDVLEALAPRQDVQLALLTGNFEDGARIKLQYFDLWRYFGSGAFGDSSHDRNSLLAIAMASAEGARGTRVRADEVVIVGDTPLDVGVALAGGTRSLGVATGSYDTAALEASGADAVLKDLSDVDAVLRGLGV
jgi:phosphoglycolate phosphatase